MYAIVKSGGKQYRVERGQQLLVERLPDDEGASVALEPILYRSEEAIFDRDGLDRVKVTAKVLGHVRGQKLRVFKFKPKRGYKRRTGHRQELTRIEVTEIALGSASRAGRARRADARAEGTAKAPRKPAAKATKASSAKPAETAEAKATEATEAKAPETPAAKATAAEAKAADTAEAKTRQTPKPKRAKKTPAVAKESPAAEDESAKESSAEAKAKKETGEDGT
jgi:large subunit ribosomal protein L21